MPRPRAEAQAPATAAARESPIPSRLADLALIVPLLALSVALGAFPLRDTDFWWHLRTGDLIRKTGQVPRLDWYTYTVPDRPWIDLHWGFEVLISWGYQLGGVLALNLGKCAITAAAVLLLVTSRRRDWPVGVMALAWVPAVLVLGGREYVRPETLTLLYLAADLAILFRIDRRPRLAFLLPIVQVCWVNTQGLFVLGPIVVAFALIDAALRPGALSADRRQWWRTVLIASGLTGLACLLNPYGLVGALFPIELARTMGEPIFAEQIAELTPIPTFIARHGLTSVPLLIQLVALLLGALSFLLPMTWSLFRRPKPEPEELRGDSRRKKGKKAVLKGSRTASEGPRSGSSRGFVFRMLLFAAFSLLSLRATRNSHQFAAVVGTVTAWNFGEWAAAIRRGRAGSMVEARAWTIPALAALAPVVLIGAVLSGAYYRICGEGRTVGLGEERLWFAHGASRFATREKMPGRGLVFHNGLASLYEYYGGPEKKVYADARLEVIGVDLFQRYSDLERRIATDAPGWEEEIAEGGYPAVLLDHVQGQTADAGATFFRRVGWRCVWFDPIASVFLRREDAEKAGAPAIDFDARHFLGDPSGPKGGDTLVASAKVYRNQAGALLNPAHPRRELAAPLIRLGLEHARRAIPLRPGQAEPLRLLGQLESFRDPRMGGSPIARFRMPFDPVFDLPTVSATFDLLRAAAIDADVSTISSIAGVFDQRLIHEESAAWFGRLAAIEPINPHQRMARQSARQILGERLRALGPAPGLEFRNTDELDRLVEDLLEHGRASTAADLLERAYPKPGGRSWPLTDRIATLRLHLGQPDRARALWDSAVDPPRPAVREARVGVSLLVEGSTDLARTRYRRALEIEPELFEALYGLAVLESDLGRASEAADAADRAVKAAPGEAARNAAGAIASAAGKFARKGP